MSKAAQKAVARKPSTSTMAKVEGQKKRGISRHLVNSLGQDNNEPMKFELPRLMPGVVPQSGPVKDASLAMDYALCDTFDYLNADGITRFFRGYPYLSQLAQIFEYRAISDIPAKEMTRKFIKLVSTSNDDNSARISTLEKALVKYRVRDVIRDALIDDGLYGKGVVYIDLKGPRNSAVTDDLDELASPLFIDKAKIPKGSLLGFNKVNSYWTSPLRYNTTNPLSNLFYSPQAWAVMGHEVSATRLISFISRPLPDLLKPTYNFSGLSMSQLAEPYVENWLRTRNSIGDALHSFSTSGVKTNLMSELGGSMNAENMTMRAAMFNALRDNKGLMLLDNDSEEFFQFNMPLSGLDALQAQALEQLCCVAQIPAVKLLGVSPQGLNASSEGEIRGFYDRIHAAQEDLIRQPLHRMIEIIQLSEFGDIDESISFEFLPLYQATDIELATIRKSDSDGAVSMVGAGILAPEEVRAKLATDPTSGYNTINVSDVPEPPEEPGINDGLDDDQEDDAAVEQEE